MRTEIAKRPHESGLRERRFSIRYPFAADAEILDFKSGVRSLRRDFRSFFGGCFVCTQKSLEPGARVHLTLKHENQSVLMLATMRVMKPGIGMGLQAQELDLSSIGTFLPWLDGLRKSR